MRLRTLVFGALAGAAIAYLFDPVSGRSRRARLQDQMNARMRSAREAAERKQRHAANLARGAMSELASPGPDMPDDATLVQRIQSEVFGSADVPKDRIALTVVDGVAELRGELDAPEEVTLVARRVETVRGVRGVRNLLRVHGQAAPNKEDALRASKQAEQRGTTGPERRAS